MDSYTVNIDFTLKRLQSELSALKKSLSDYSKNLSVSKLVEQSQQIKNNIQQAASAFAKLGASNPATQFLKGLQGLGATSNFNRGLQQTLSLQQQFLKGQLALEKGIVAPWKAADTSIKDYNAVMKQAAFAAQEVLRQPMIPVALRNIVGQTITALKQVPSTAGWQRFSSTVQSGASKAVAALRQIATAGGNYIKNLDTRIKGNVSMLTAWWQHFGRIAIGFTIAYRAMNAFEAIISKTSETIRTAIKESGELATLQGKLALFTTMASKDSIDFNTAFKQSGAVVQGLAKASVRSISSIEELGIAMDELAQHGVLVTPNLTEEFTSFADFTSLIAQTTGDNVRQLRSEINALMEGQMRANNTLIRAMKNFGILDDKMLDDLRKMRNRGEIVETLFKAIHERWMKFVNIAISSNPALAFSVWEKAIRRTMITAIGLVSNARGQFNLFAATIKDHIDTWNNAFKGDLTQNTQIKQFAVLMVQLNRVLDFALTSFEKFVGFLAQAATVFTNLDDSIKKVLKALLLWEALVIGFKGIKLLVGLVVSLNTGLLKVMLTTSPLITAFTLLAGGAFIVNVAIKAFSGDLDTHAEKVTKYSIAIQALTEAMGKLKFTMIFFMAGSRFGQIGAVLGTALGAGLDIGVAAGKYVNELKSVEGQVKTLREQLQQEEKEYATIGQSLDKVSTNLNNKNADMAKSALHDWNLLTKQHEEKFKAIEQIKARITSLQNQKLEMIKGDSGLKTFVNQLLEEASAAVDAGMKSLEPLLKSFKEKWQALANPDIALKDFDISGEFQKMMNQLQAEEDGTMKELDKMTTKMYDRFIAAVDEGNRALAESYKLPAQYELEIRKASIENLLKTAKAQLDVPGIGKAAYKEWSVKVAELNAQLGETQKLLDGIEANLQMADIMNTISGLKIQYEYIQKTFADGTIANKRALIELREQYQILFNTLSVMPQTDDQRSALKDLQDQLEDLNKVTLDWKDGVQQAFDEIGNVDSVKEFYSFTTSVFDNLGDGIANFASRGKKAFADMINSMLTDLLRLIVKMQIISPLAQMLGATFFPTSATTALDRYSYSTQTGGIPHAQGGWLNEKIVGIGLNSGKMHTFAEQGPEYVVPQDKMGEHKTEVNIYGAPAGTQVKESTQNGIKRIDVYIDELVASKLAGGSRSATTLRRMYGLSPALAGR